MTMFYYGMLSIAVLAFCGLVYIYLCRAENREYNEWLEGYLMAERAIESGTMPRGAILAWFWDLEKNSKGREQFINGWRECLLDKGYLR